MRILPRKLGPGRHAVDTPSILLGHAALEATLMLDGKSAICILREDDRPDTEVVAMTLVRVSVPLVEVSELKYKLLGMKISYDRDFFGIGCPLPVFEVAIFVYIQTESFIAISCEIYE